MLTRERIIIFVMIMVVAYGAFNFWSKPEQTSFVEGSQKKLADLKQFVVEAATSLSKEYISAADQYIIERAEKQWPQSPFLRTGALLASEPFEAKAQVTSEAIRFAYTGFIQTSERLLAIINGLEYETGEQLSEGGYYIRKISPRSVLIGVKNSDENIALPLDEAVSVSLESKE